MKKLLVFFPLLIFSSFQQYQLVKTKINDQITVSIPVDFFIVPEEELVSKSISYRNPIAVYTDISTKIDFVVNNSIAKWRPSDIELMQSFYKTNISALYDKVEFITEKIEVINKRNYIVFEFISTILPNENTIRTEAPVVRYNYLQYVIVKGEIFLFNFSSPVSVKDQWKNLAYEMMHTIKIK